MCGGGVWPWSLKIKLTAAASDAQGRVPSRGHHERLQGPRRSPGKSVLGPMAPGL